MRIPKRFEYFLRNLLKRIEQNELLELCGVIGGQLLPHEYVKTLTTLRAYNQSPNTLVDVGAHRGVFAECTCKFFDIEQCVCVEPNRDLHDDIRIRMNGRQFVIDSDAIGLRSEDAVYYKHEDTSMNSLVRANDDVLKQKFPYDDPLKIEHTTVRTTTLNDLVVRHGIQNNSILLKIDTQGNELDVLRSGTQILPNCCLVIVEHMFVDAYNIDYTFEELVVFFVNNGFLCRGPVSISYRPNRETSSVDFLFTRT